VGQGEAKRAHSTWEQSGHLRGHLSKHRSHPVLTPVNTTYGLLLAYLSGSRGQLLVRSFWGRLLAKNPSRDRQGPVALRWGAPPAIWERDRSLTVAARMADW